jgi:hypothetical protein
MMMGHYMMPIVKYPAELVTAAEGYEGKQFWPGSQAFRFRQLVSWAYPMVMAETAGFLIVALNSCLISSDSIADSAFGRLGPDQLQRLDLLLQGADDKCKVLLVHHHLGFPPAVRSRMEKSSSKIQIKALQLRDAKKLDVLLQRFSRIVVFHGHKHVSYRATRNSAVIVSGPSVAYGDVGGGASNCFVYGIDRQGRVSVLEETSILPGTKDSA